MTISRKEGVEILGNYNRTNAQGVSYSQLVVDVWFLPR
jgi:hypothetical protein